MPRARQSIQQGMGMQIVLMAMPVVALIAAACYIYRDTLREYWRKWTSQPVLDPARGGRVVYQAAQCPICLEPEQLAVSATCGHQFCGSCIEDMYTRSGSRLKCPCCRRDMTTIFKLFEPHDPPTEDERKVIQMVKTYNYTYADDRGILRTIFELPYIWTQIKRAFRDPNFLRFLLRNFWKYRMIFMLIVYVLSPFDLISESTMGIIGLVDDLIIVIVVLALVGQAVMAFIRA